MKGVLEIRKLLWLINLILLSILIYSIFSFIYGSSAAKSTYANPIPFIEKAGIIPSKNHLPCSNHKIIVERNIFGSSGLSPAKKNSQREKLETPLSVIVAQLRLLATVAGDDQVACAVIENLNSKVQAIYKTGDIIKGAKIERIDRNKIVLLCEEHSEVLNLCISRGTLDPVEKNEDPVMAEKQNTAPYLKAISSAKKAINPKAYISKVQGMETILEKMEIIPYVEDGEKKGLCIAGMDNLGIPGYFGFENGDVIQTINGQMLTGKQKAFQVLKKARSQSSLNFQLLRNRQKLDLSFEIKQRL
jgi:type II secretory pathway component PulC